MTAEKDSFLTIAKALRAPELKVKGSRFIADIVPAVSKEEVEKTLRVIRKEFHDATHHCFAYRLGIGSTLTRAADDGEPSGTAGKPILFVLTTNKLTNVLLVVTRYFGGTKLGTGPLARAYAEAAQQALSLSKIIRVHLTDTLSLQVPYDDEPAFGRFLRRMKLEATDVHYLDSVRLQV